MYTLEMSRWGEPDNHTYCCGVYTSLVKALDAGILHSVYRGGKYEPLIHMMEIDEPGTGNRMCEGISQARYLFAELTGAEWRDKNDE